MVGFLCNECGKSFAEDIDLALHERRTHDKRTFPCEKCVETLVGQSKYSNHMRKHKSGVAKAKALRKCDSCPNETTDASNLSRHITLVHKEKQKRKNNPKECNDCGQVFFTQIFFWKVWRKEELNCHSQLQRRQQSIPNTAAGSTCNKRTDKQTQDL